MLSSILEETKTANPVSGATIAISASTPTVSSYNYKGATVSD